MANKLLFILNNGLEAYSSFLSGLDQHERLEVRIIGLEHLLSKEFIETIVSYKPLEIALALHESVFLTDRKKIQEQFRSAFNAGFFNYIILKTGGKLDQEDVLIGKTHCFFLEKAGQAMSARNLLLYAVKVFNEAVLSERLQGYIINTVENIVDSEMLRKQKEEVEHLNLELERKNRTDTLTNLYNRQAVFEVLDREVKRVHRLIWRFKHAQESNEPITIPESVETQLKDFGKPSGTLMEHLGVFSVLMIDVDHFKKINDTYGHVMGDVVLRTLGELMNRKSIFRETDILGRFGGEEFIGIFPETSAQHVLIPVQRFVDELGRMEFTCKEGQSFRVTFSAGIAEFRMNDSSTESVIARADKALYWAKEHGRNRVVIYDDVFSDSDSEPTERDPACACRESYGRTEPEQKPISGA